MRTLRDRPEAECRRQAVATVVVGLLIALFAGCGIQDAYDVEKDDPPEAPQGIPDYRMPPPPQTAPPQYTPPAQLTPTSVSEPAEPPVMLADLEQRAEGSRQFKFALDERRRRYHRVNCPYAPHNARGYDLEVQGQELVARSVLEQTGTHQTKAEIEARGYKPCQHCRPDLGKAPPWFGGRSEDYRRRQALPYDPENPSRHAGSQE